MTRFIFIGDSHWGANPQGYQQQKAQPEKLPEIVAALDRWIKGHGQIDFVLHGGDMVNAGTDEMIAGAANLFALSVPVYLCLGNHDLSESSSVDTWLARAPRLFRHDSPTYTIETDACDIHIVPNHWCETPYYWRDAQAVHFTDEQLQQLQRKLEAHTGKPHLLVTHSPVHGVPREQTGFPEVYHSPGAPFQTCVMDLVHRYKQIHWILGCHNHINMNLEQERVNFTTVSALSEVPFEFKVCEVTADRIAMSTVSLLDSLAIEGHYDFDKTYVQGRGKDRAFSRTLSVNNALNQDIKPAS